MSEPLQYLLLLSCSQRKTANLGQIAAHERYDGVNFRVVKKALREGLSLESLDIMIISAKYGLLNWDTFIEDYDLRMTPQRALELQSVVSKQVDQLLLTNSYKSIFINLGRTYLQAVAASRELRHISGNVTYATGGIGQKMAQMKEWLNSFY